MRVRTKSSGYVRRQAVAPANAPDIAPSQNKLRRCPRTRSLYKSEQDKRMHLFGTMRSTLIVLPRHSARKPSL